MTSKSERKLSAEQTRVVDLQRIKDMNSTTGIDPLQQFPKEIWMMIFDKLVPEDIGNIWQLHPVFENLLGEHRIRDLLFAQILKVPAFQLCLQTEHGFSEGLRRISKSSRNSFDCFMEDQLRKMCRKGTEASSRLRVRHVPHLCISEDEIGECRRLKELLGYFQDVENPVKRYFLRGLTISFSEMDFIFDVEDTQTLLDLRNQFKSDVTALLEIIGDQILHFRFFLHELRVLAPPYSLSQVYILFQRWISLMPNLQWLEYCIDFDSLNGEEAPSISDLMRTHPFPHLSSLERLSLHFKCALGQMDVFENVLAANQHIQILDFTDVEDFCLQQLPTHLIQSLSLNSISVSSDGIDTDNPFGVSLTWIEPIVNFNWQLKTISLDLNMKEVKLNSVFRFLEKFPTLETVKLSRLYGLKIGEDVDMLGYLELPNLTSLNLHLRDAVVDYRYNVHFFYSLQFLERCKLLKTLSWTLISDWIDDAQLRCYLKTHEEESGESLDFRAGLRCLYESNLWNVFPSLETVNVQVFKARRENVKIDDPDFCSHKYHRLGAGERMSVGQFLKCHKCSRDNDLHNCVVLVE